MKINEIIRVKCKSCVAELAMCVHLYMSLALATGMLIWLHDGHSLE